MSSMKYETILKQAKSCQNNVKKDYTTGISNNWSYYFAKAIITPKKNISKIENLLTAQNPTGNNISRQINKKDYQTVCKTLIKYVESKKRLPNYVTWGTLKIHPKLLTEVLSRILVYYDKNKALPNYANINSKVFTKPVETGNSVYDYFVKKTGKKFQYIDDLLEWMQGRNYGYYYDDVYSNKQCIDRMINRQGINCTDSLQFLINMAEQMGYEWKCIHVKCSGGDGHVRGQFRKKGTSNWFNRDPASVLDGSSISSIWCSNGSVLAVNPSWFMNNLNR